MENKIQKEKVREFVDLGFASPYEFPGEYMLLIHPKTLDKVRVYVNGDVWKTDATTGEYFRSVE